jgi:hypothetical protein
MMNKDWHTTIRILAVLAFAVWIIQSPYSGWWIVLAAMIAGL